MTEKHESAGRRRGAGSRAILILGAGVMQGPAIRIARGLGLRAVAVDGSPDAPCAREADAFERIDLGDAAGVEAFARSLSGGPGGLGGVMTAGTDFSATAAWVAQSLGLPGIPHEAALNASDKGRMRAAFRRAGLPSPDFAVVGERECAGGFPLPAPFPLVVKPVDSMGGRGCRMAGCMGELLEAAREAMRFSRTGRAIVEAYVGGPEFSVDAIVRGDEISVCGVADRHVFFPPCFIEMGHTMPSNFPDADIRAVLGAFRSGVRALGIAGAGNVGAAKGDVKLSPSGPVIGEIAARLSGGYMSGWTYPYSSGAEPIRAAVLLAMGLDPGDMAPRLSMTSAERAFVSIPGTVREILGEGEARADPLVRDLFLRAAPGQRVRFPEDNVSKCGNAISAAPGRAEAVAAAEGAARAVLLRLAPGDPQTDAFLAGRGGFPPDAFALGPELRALLDAMPDSRRAAASAGEAALAGESRLAVEPFPEFMESGLRDYMGRSPAESLEAARRLVGLPLPEMRGGGIAESAEKSDNEVICLGRPFWAAMARGGCQGAAYFVDGLPEKKP